MRIHNCKQRYMTLRVDNGGKNYGELTIYATLENNTLRT